MSVLLRRSARALGPLLLVVAFIRDLAGQTFGVAVTPQGSIIANKTAFTTGLTYAFRVTNEDTQQSQPSFARTRRVMPAIENEWRRGRPRPGRPIQRETPDPRAE